MSVARFVGAQRLAPALLLVLAVFTSASAQDRTADQPGWLGVSIQDVTDELSQALPRGVHDGALINGVVDDSPADLAGLREGDVVVKVDRARINNSSDLTRAIREAGAGETVILEYYRDGRRKRAEAELTERSDSSDWRSPYRRRGRSLGRDDSHTPYAPKVYQFSPKMPEIWGYVAGAHGPRLGVHLSELSAQLGDYFGVDQGEGTLVTEVVEDSPAEAAGIKAGDVIVSIDQHSVSDASEVRDALREFAEGGPVDIDIVRDGRRQTVTAELEEVHRRSRHSGSRWPRARAFTIPDFPDWEFEEFEEQMEELRRELDELRQELSDLRKDL